MIVLGHSEPRWSTTTRVIRKTTVPLDDLVATDAVVITVPEPSIMVTISTSSNRVRELTIYYECTPDDGQHDLKVPLLMVVPGETIPPDYRLLGHTWVGDSLAAIYAGVGEPA